jgi:chromosome segregation ATPase
LASTKERMGDSMKLELVGDKEKLCASLIGEYCYDEVEDVITEACKHQLCADQLILDAELAKKDAIIKELSAKTNRQRAELADVKIPLERKIIAQRNQIQKLTFECANLQKQFDESMASYYEVLELKRQATAHVEELKAQLKNQTEIAQKYEDRYFSSKADVANAESVAWDLQKQIEELSTMASW